MIVIIIILICLMSCSVPISNQDNQQNDKDSRLLGTWFWKGRSNFTKITFKDSSYYQIIDGTEFAGDWVTRNDSMILDNGAGGITDYKVISQNEWWQSHPYFIWIPYVRDSNLTYTNITDSGNFNTDNIGVFIGNYTLLNSLSFTINPNYDTTFFYDIQGDMSINSSKIMNQILIKSGNPDTTTLRILNIENDTLILCFDDTIYINYSTKLFNDTLSLYSVIGTNIGCDVEVLFWLKNNNIVKIKR